MKRVNGNKKISNIAVRTGTADLHPLIIMAFYLFTLIFTMLALNPYYAAVSFIAAFIFAVRVHGIKAVRFALFFCLPALIAFTAFNTAFVREGVTVFLYVNGKQLTLEAVLNGLTSGTLFCAVIMWFFTFNNVAGSDKITAVLARSLPQTALVITMTMRLIPKLRNRAAEIADAQTMIGRGVKGKSVFKRIRCGLNIMSVLITWSLENGVDTSDSMRARGYGAAKRTRPANRKLYFKDVSAAVFIAVFAAAGIAGAFTGAVSFAFYPKISAALTGLDVFFIICFAFYCFFPVFFEASESLKWRLLKSRI